MSDKKYVVPEGGLKAALGQVDYARAHSGVEEGIIKRALQDFVRWFSDDLEGKIKDNPYLNDQYMRSESMAENYNRTGRNSAIREVMRMFVEPVPVDDREMTTYDCLDCKKSWKQQLREKVASCVYCQSYNTKSVATIYGIKDYPVPTWKDFVYTSGMPKYVSPQEESIIDVMDRRMAEYSDWLSSNLSRATNGEDLLPRLEWDKPHRKVFTYADRMKAGK